VPQSPGGEPKRRRRGWLIAGVLLVLLAFGTYRFLTQSNPSKPSGGPANAPPQPVGAAPVSKGDIRIIVDALGTVTPLATVTVKTQINGQLTAVGFHFESFKGIRTKQKMRSEDALAKFENAPYETVRPKFNVSHSKSLLLLGWFTPTPSRHGVVGNPNG
jgi:membrane fusion protein, multidrug efflux system